MRMYASSSWKGLMYVAVAVGNIQGKSRFTVAEGESRNSTVAEGGMLVSNKNSVKRKVRYSLVYKSSGSVVSA